jgi:hypothetical protein
MDHWASWALSYKVHIGARVLLDISLIRFGISLAYPSGGGGWYFTSSNDFYLPSLRLEKWGVGVRKNNVGLLCPPILQVLFTSSIEIRIRILVKSNWSRIRLVNLKFHSFCHNHGFFILKETIHSVTSMGFSSKKIILLSHPWVFHLKNHSSVTSIGFSFKKSFFCHILRFFILKRNP